MERLELENWIQETLASGGGPEKSLALAVQDLLWELTAERQARVAAEETLDFYKASADAMPNPIFMKDEDLRFVFFNRAYRNFFGLAEGENIGKRVQDLDYLPQEDRERYHAEDSELLRSLSGIQYDTTYKTAGRDEVEALYWSKGFPVPGTDRRGLIGEIVDISKEKQVQRELTRSMRTLEVLMRDAKDASNTDPLTKLYNRNILDEDIPAVIKETVSLGQPICMVLIDVDYFKMINDTFGHPFGDEMLRRFAKTLKQSFRQRDLAIRYGGEARHVVVRLTKEADSALCQVQDFGPGIPQDEIEHIWERYHRASAHTARSTSGGTGLGLSIVREILTLHEAEYGVESKEGEGSTFWFRLKGPAAKNTLKLRLEK